MNADFNTRFLTDTDETGRFIVSSIRTGCKYYVEVIIDGHTPEWGSIDPATGNLMHKKGDGKFTGGIKEKDSLIQPKNGFTKVHYCGVGTSPHGVIAILDAAKPDKIAA